MDSAGCFQVAVRGVKGAEEGHGAAFAMLELRRQVQSFGSVVAVEPLPSPVCGLLVTYADAWAAAAAREALASQAWSVAEDGFDKKVFEPFAPGSWCVDGVPTQASLTPYTSGSDSPCELSSETSSHDLRSLSEAESEEVQGVSRSSFKASSALGPKFLSGLELSQLNWKGFADGSEWRRDLMLRGLPKVLCDRDSLEAFLVANGLCELVSELRVLPGKGLRPGSATVLAASADAAARLAKFFHGAQLPGARSPVAVSFAAGRCAHRRNLEPMRVPAGVPPPPGLESQKCTL